MFEPNRKEMLKEFSNKISREELDGSIVIYIYRDRNMEIFCDKPIIIIENNEDENLKIYKNDKTTSREEIFNMALQSKEDCIMMSGEDGYDSD